MGVTPTIEPAQTGGRMITLTETAAGKVKELLADKGYSVENIT